MSAPQVDRLYTIGEGGRRNFLHPATTHGKWTTRRRIVGITLMALLVSLPFVDVGGAPAIWLDVTRRRFAVIGFHLGPTDGYLLFFLLSGVAFALVVMSALWGRVWCGFACPQTVFLEQLYRPIERLFEGSREAQLRLAQAPWSIQKAARKVGKHAAFGVLSMLLANLFLAYFVSAASLWSLMRQGPSAEPGIFVWAVVVSALMYFNFAWFREQLCIIICPYGRLQSVLSDADTIAVTYHSQRGEPRGKVNNPDAGACIDCNRCVAVCPTGIDIRQGTQLECVGCSSCIDACDEVMRKLGRAPGLIRYESEHGLTGKRRFFRPRLALYAALMLAGVSATVLTARAHRPFAATLTRQPGPPFVVDGDEVRNVFVLKADNPDREAKTLRIALQLPADARIVVSAPEVTLEPGATSRFPIVLARPAGVGGFDFSVHVSTINGQASTISARFAAP